MWGSGTDDRNFIDTEGGVRGHRVSDVDIAALWVSMSSGRRIDYIELNWVMTS